MSVEQDQSHLITLLRVRGAERGYSRFGDQAGGSEPASTEDGQMSHMSQRISSLRKQMGCLNGSEKQGRRANRKEGPRARKAREDIMKAYTVQCFLNVTSVLTCTDGLICVAIACMGKVSPLSLRSINTQHNMPSTSTGFILFITLSKSDRHR